ncbi:MAG: hypothetical protein IJD01_06105 [Clostridia bacterium]|nr:hypothetical protein [Clostridia bacterium]
MKGWMLWAVTAVMVTAAVTGALLTATPRPAATEPTEVYRVVREWDGRVAVFLPQGNTPEAVYDTWVSSLPEADRERLCEGVAVYSHSALREVLEDYTS